MHRVLIPALAIIVVSVFAVSGHADNQSVPIEQVESAQCDTPVELGSKGLGERCFRDGECASKECKGFKCVRRSGDRPLLPNGKACSFDGDCRSDECHKGRCIPKQ